MFEEYKNLLSWNQIKKLNSWEELQSYPSSYQLYLVGLSTLRALGHWQVLLALAFLGMCAYFGIKIGNIFGLKIGIFNLVGLSGCIVGGAVYSIVHAYEAKKSLRKIMMKNTDGEKL